MIRLPGIQLIYCEAMNKYSGPSAEIYNILNALRARSFMAPVPPGLSAAELHKYIQRERRVELFYENKRYFYARWKLEPDSDIDSSRKRLLKPRLLLSWFGLTPGRKGQLTA